MKNRKSRQVFFLGRIEVWRAERVARARRKPRGDACAESAYGLNAKTAPAFEAPLEVAPKSTPFLPMIKPLRGLAPSEPPVNL